MKFKIDPGYKPCKQIFNLSTRNTTTTTTTTTTEFANERYFNDLFWNLWKLGSKRMAFVGWVGTGMELRQRSG